LDTKNFISIKKAKEHNLKGIDIDIPRRSFVVITGLSGSGKSSLAFDTIYAEGQRRYIESLSSYARQFLDQMEKPDVESITGLTPTIAIEQKTRGSTPRSTVATSTEIYDYMRVLFARVGKATCYKCGREISTQSAEDITRCLLQYPPNTKLQVLSPLIKSAKGEHKEVFKRLLRDGFSKVRVDGQIYNIEEVPKLEKTFNHNIDAIVDRVVLQSGVKKQLSEAVEIALQMSQGLIAIIYQKPKTSEWLEELFSENFTCPQHGMLLPEISPRVFSFNSPFGACPECNGLGNLLEPDENLMIPDENLTLAEGAIYVWKRCGSGIVRLYSYDKAIRWLCNSLQITGETKWKDLPADTKKKIFYGFRVNRNRSYEGIIAHLKKRFYYAPSESLKKKLHEFMSKKGCTICGGARLKKEVLAITIGEKNIAELNHLTVENIIKFFQEIKFTKEQKVIAEPVQKAILEKLKFLEDVGLNYLSLDRETNSLSGGESQRIRLACQLGSQLAGVTYVLDEPTIGLHQRDNLRLIQTLRKLQAYDNTVIVVEHDRDVILTADQIIDIGPGAGEHGGKIVAQASPKEMLKMDNLTAKYLKEEMAIPIPKARRKSKKTILLEGCAANNLKNISVQFPLDVFVCLTGVSGSGKSTLAIECLYKNLLKFMGNQKIKAGVIGKIKGAEQIDKIIFIDQSPIGRTSRSNPATYTGVFDPIRKLFAMSLEAKARGYQPGRFSFNVKGGRCEACQGQGYKNIEMFFLPDVSVICESCQGARYNQQTLEIQYRGKNISQVLDMTVEKAKVFFQNHRNISPYLETLDRIGLGYIRLGQPAPSLSGGEAQRVKLATELSRPSTTKTLYIMDEPTTGLHFHDVDKLIKIIHDLVEKKNTVLVIEHNLDIIKCADWLIDLGPEGGARGGKILETGTPEQIQQSKNSWTGKFLKSVLKKTKSSK
jgi:excinuclease ABC subunit A